MKNLKLLSVVSAVLWSVTVQQAGALDSVPMARNEVELSSVLSEHTLDWAPAYCMPQLISFQAGSRTLSIAQARAAWVPTLTTTVQATRTDTPNGGCSASTSGA